MKVRSVQPTPNPNAFKFVLDTRVVASGVRNYTEPAQVKGDPLGAALFAIEGVDTLFFCEDFITVSMLESADWREVHDRVVEVLQVHQAPAAATARAPEGAHDGASTLAEAGTGDPELLARINDLIDDRVRPALAGDGGGLEILGLDGKKLRIRYQGACGSCPSSTAGTLVAIQGLIQTEIDEAIEVVSA
jgi:Fe-S cluster biogenesis protein NfuA